MTDGLLERGGRFHALGRLDTKAIEQRFRKLVLARLRRAERLSESFEQTLLSWDPSGFSVHAGEAIEATQKESLERMARYMTRGPIAQARVFEQKEGRVKLLTPPDPRTGQGHLLFDPLEWVHAVTTQIPDDRQHLVRYQGAYANTKGTQTSYSEPSWSCKPAWRAIHFACHGLIESKDVMASSLAISAGAGSDGFLTAREVTPLPMHTRLVTLSACESGRGEAIMGEGMLGLAQALMVSGASSVLSSPWKVDDEATQALMIKFYELWQPTGKPTEAAKRDAVSAPRAAQDYIRTRPDHESWSHPYY